MGKEKYNPPYTVSEEAVNLIAEISSAIERYNITMAGADGLRLRKINRVKTIRGSTAIEGNTLSEEQITAVLEGKRVVAPKKEIDEVLGAAAAYEQIENINPYKVKDLLKVHKLMMGGLVDEAGAFRSKSVGVIDGAGNVIHMAPNAEQVPTLVKSLFKWLNESGAILWSRAAYSITSLSSSIHLPMAMDALEDIGKRQFWGNGERLSMPHR